jgi:hypothetical protein
MPGAIIQVRAVHSLTRHATVRDDDHRCARVSRIAAWRRARQGLDNRLMIPTQASARRIAAWRNERFVSVTAAPGEILSR